MKNILAEIMTTKRKEVDARKELYPTRLLEKSIYFDAQPVSLVRYLNRQDKNGIIAEYKRKSPSRGTFPTQQSVEKISIGYMQAGASGLSILTDSTYFGGKNEDLEKARAFNFCPILRKDFILDEYQIIESRAIGADVVLLIAAALTVEEIKHLAKFAKTIGLEVLLEVHNQKELEQYFTSDVDILGVNNRDLSTFKTDIEVSRKLAEFIPKEVISISESGLDKPEDVIELKKSGYKGFLIGENFLKTGLPDIACADFIAKIQKIGM